MHNRRYRNTNKNGKIYRKLNFAKLKNEHPKKTCSHRKIPKLVSAALALAILRLVLFRLRKFSSALIVDFAKFIFLRKKDGRNFDCKASLCHFPSTRWLQFCFYTLVLALFWALRKNGRSWEKGVISKTDCHSEPLA